jgi:hypothetical protein
VTRHSNQSRSRLFSEFKTLCPSTDFSQPYDDETLGDLSCNAHGIPSSQNSFLASVPEILQRVLNATHTEYVTESGILTLIYDFKKPQELDDFSFAGRRPIVCRGVMRLDPNDTLEHIVRFQNASISGFYSVHHNENFLATTHGPSLAMELGLARFCIRHHGRDLVTGPACPKNGLLSAALTIAPHRTSAVLLGSEISIALETHRVGHVQLLGGRSGRSISALVISGTLDHQWVKGLLAD